MSERKAVIFDLDGTLLDTLQDLADSGNAVLEAYGHPTHSADAYRTFIGDGMANLVLRIFPESHRPATDEATATVLARYREAYGRNWQNTTVPFPGIPELLDSLKERGIPVGVLSNKAHDFTEKCVEAFLGDWHWDVVLGAKDGVEKKPHPEAALEAAARFGVEPGSCFFVGDSNVDMQTATAAGMRAVGVSWGFRTVEELRQAGAEAILDTPEDLLGLLE